MALTVNQILVICLILVLIGFVVVMAVMAKHAIELLKKTKVLVGDGQELVEASKGKVNEAGDKIIGAATAVITDTAPAVKAVGATAGGLTAINLVSMVGRGLVRNGGFFAARADRRARKIARKELKKSRKMVKKVNKQAKLEAKAVKRAKQVTAKIQKAERKADKKASKKAAKKAKKEAKKARRAARKAARKAQ